MTTNEKDVYGVLDTLLDEVISLLNAQAIEYYNDGNGDGAMDFRQAQQKCSIIRIALSTLKVIAFDVNKLHRSAHSGNVDYGKLYKTIDYFHNRLNGGLDTDSISMAKEVKDRMISSGILVTEN